MSNPEFDKRQDIRLQWYSLEMLQMLKEIVTENDRQPFGYPEIPVIKKAISRASSATCPAPLRWQRSGC
jgi:hypothetical protein